MKEILRLHKLWLDLDKKGIRADLRGADLSEADLRRISLCNATIDGAIVRPDDIGGPGHILCALTEDEWETIRKKREV